MKRIAMAVLAATLVLAGCADDEAVETSASAGAGASGPAPNTVEYFNVVVGDRVFFETNSFQLGGPAQDTLRRQAEWLRANAGNNVTIEGHADERGTRQYNLALGARRANSVRQFLISQGVDGARLRAVSFGKERPVALCSDESCWSQNRRSVSVVGTAPTG